MIAPKFPLPLWEREGGAKRRKGEGEVGCTTSARLSFSES